MIVICSKVNSWKHNCSTVDVSGVSVVGKSSFIELWPQYRGNIRGVSQKSCICVGISYFEFKGCP